MFRRHARRTLFLMIALLGAFVIGGYTCTGPLRTDARATASSGHWSGYWTWTWDGHKWVAKWIWIWVSDGGDYSPS